MNFEINKLQRDEFGRVHGIIAVNKPEGITSHDVVYATRKALGTKKVGHAGALDPFATGVILILVGKATKLSDHYINHDKEYVMRMLFGISTNSADTEGEITDIQEVSEVITNLDDVLEQFTPEYEQYVPVFSSVKVDGQKLRVLARKYDNFELVNKEDGKYVVFTSENTSKEVKLPKHVCKIPTMSIRSQTITDISNTDFWQKNQDKLTSSNYPVAEVAVACSKGTYIRTLAEDIGSALSPPLPAMLIGLQRTQVGDVNISQAIDIEEIGSL